MGREARYVTRRRSCQSKWVSCIDDLLSDDAQAALLVDASVDPSEQNLDDEFCIQLAVVRRSVNDVTDAVVLAQSVVKLVEELSGITAIPYLHELYADLQRSDPFFVSTETSTPAEAHTCVRGKLWASRRLAVVTMTASGSSAKAVVPVRFPTIYNGKRGSLLGAPSVMTM